MRNVLITLVLGSTVLVSGQASASIISNLNNVAAPKQVVDFNDVNGLFFGSGSTYVTNVPQVTFSSLNGDFTAGQYVADLGINGLWGAGKSFLSFDTIGDMTLKIDFGGLKTRSFAAEWSLYEETDDFRNLTVTAWGVDGSSESFTIQSFKEALDGIDIDDNELLTSYNYSFTRGIKLANADIAFVTIQGDGVVMDNFTYTMPVPEPTSYALLLAGLGLIGCLARRRT
ncbi:MAG: PEP-CTERM sorting domain-containing protein [Rhodocyclaceae bacterium]